SRTERRSARASSTSLRRATSRSTCPASPHGFASATARWSTELQEPREHLLLAPAGEESDDRRLAVADDLHDLAAPELLMHHVHAATELDALGHRVGAVVFDVALAGIALHLLYGTALAH